MSEAQVPQHTVCRPGLKSHLEEWRVHTLQQQSLCLSSLERSQIAFWEKEKEQATPVIAVDSWS